MYSIRKAGLEDTDTVVDGRLQLLKATRDHNFRFPSDFRQKTEEYILSQSEQGLMHSWIAEDASGKCVGVISLLLWSRPPLPEGTGSYEACIVNAYVDPVVRRKGIGSQLVSESLKAAERFDVKRVVLRTTDEGLPLYTSHGFVRDDAQMEYAIG